MAAMTISVIIPTLNEESTLAHTLEHTFQLGFDEIIVVDGGSTDRTRGIVLHFAMSRERSDLISCPVTSTNASCGRATQMNAGAALSRSDVLLFLHADTLLPDHAREAIEKALSEAPCMGGRFDIRFAQNTWVGSVISTMMNARSRLSGIATGDQAIFVRRETFEAMGGYAAIPLMEDIDFTRRLKRQGRVATLRHQVTTSYRRWESQGPIRTIVFMWALRLLYWCGVSPEKLSRFYAAVRRENL